MRTLQGTRPGAPPSLQSVSVLVHPDQVLHHPSLSVEEKRALLSSWASDRRAVENAPALRRLDSGATVCVDEILAALAALPAGAAAPAFVFGAKQDVRPVKTAVSGEQSRKTQGFY